MKKIVYNYYFYVLSFFKKKIIELKEKHEKLYFFMFCIRKINDKEFVSLIINRKNILNLCHFGNDNSDKLLYFIDIKSNAMGFGAFFRWAVHILYDAENIKAIPVIRFGEGCPYLENNNFMNTNNPFEYYFEQPTGFGVDDIYQSHNVVVFNGWSLVRIDENLGIIKNDDDMPVGYQNITEDYLQTLGTIVKKYIRLNKQTKKFLEESVESIFPEDWQNKKILAVHVRGTDFALHWDQHPNIVQPDDFFKVIDKAINNNGFEYIFLATDDSLRLELFKEKYKDKLLYFKDVHRSSGKVNVSFEKNDRLNNNYLNGLEVLRDMYTMAYCNGFLAGLSQVSVSARIINRSLTRHFEYEQIIDKGIYKV